MSIRRLVWLLVFCGLVGHVGAATLYTVRPLIDANRPELSFEPGASYFGNFDLNGFPSVLGNVLQNGVNLAAIGQLSPQGFSITTYDPLPGHEASSIMRALDDGSVLGFSWRFEIRDLPPQGPTPVAFPTAVRWVNGEPSIVGLEDALPDGSFLELPLANDAGIIAGRTSHEGGIGYFEYNVFSGHLELIGQPSGAIPGMGTLFALNAEGKLLLQT